MKAKLGQVFTPANIVARILDEAGYSGKAILGKKVMEPSFGEGAFLIAILQRLIAAGRAEKISRRTLEKLIATSLYGVELDTGSYTKTLVQLNAMMVAEGLTPPAVWNLVNANALTSSPPAQTFDFVFGNPPYIRIHDLPLATRSYLKANYAFCKQGMLDLYLSFFELGLNFLNPTGKLAFITPNSYMKNTSSEAFRKYLLTNNLITKIIDFKSAQVFEKVTTYTCITVLAKANQEKNFTYTAATLNKDIFSTQINLETCSTKRWCFNNPQEERLLVNFTTGQHKLEAFCNIQYGLTTLRDSIFVAEDGTPIGKNYFSFKGEKVEKQILKKIVKGSTYKGKKNYAHILFPYEKNKTRFVPMPEATLQKDYPLAYAYLLKNKAELLKRDMDKGAKEWFQFGRSQGLINMAKPKLIVSPLIKGKIKVFLVGPEVFVYSGIFITAKNKEALKQVEKILRSKAFHKYVMLTSKEFRGGYISLNTKQLKNYTPAEPLEI